MLWYGREFYMGMDWRLLLLPGKSDAEKFLKSLGFLRYCGGRM